MNWWDTWKVQPQEESWQEKMDKATSKSMEELGDDGFWSMSDEDWDKGKWS